MYRRYHDRLERFCRKRVGDQHTAEEVTQEAFTRALTALPDLTGELRFYPWVSVIAARLCVDCHRRQSAVGTRRRPRPGPVAGGQDDIVDAVDVSLVVAALARLAPRHQDVLHLREVEGWSYQRIADHYGVKIGTVETLLFRARRALRREFHLVDGAGLAAMPVLGRIDPGGGAAPQPACPPGCRRLPSPIDGGCRGVGNRRGRGPGRGTGRPDRDPDRRPPAAAPRPRHAVGPAAAGMSASPSLSPSCRPAAIPRSRSPRPRRARRARSLVPQPCCRCDRDTAPAATTVMPATNRTLVHRVRDSRVRPSVELAAGDHLPRRRFPDRCRWPVSPRSCRFRFCLVPRCLVPRWCCRLSASLPYRYRPADVVAPAGTVARRRPGVLNPVAGGSFRGTDTPALGHSVERQRRVPSR